MLYKIFAYHNLVFTDVFFLKCTYNNYGVNWGIIQELATLSLTELVGHPG